MELPFFIILYNKFKYLGNLCISHCFFFTTNGHSITQTRDDRGN